MTRLTLLLFALLLLPPSLNAQAVPTDIVVRVVANDAKIIGSGVGGVRITVRSLDTGEVLATGLQEGATGDTDRIMRAPRERDATVFDTEGAGAFRTSLALEGPTRVEIVAEGPLGTEHAMQRASRTLLLIPGEHMTGEGIILVLNGFTVVIEEPTGDAVPTGSELRVVANVTMLCGCPTQPGGLWDSDDYRIEARLLRNGQVVARTPMTYTGETSTYSGVLETDEAGTLQLQVMAVDAGRANAGLATREIRVGGAP